MITRVLSKRKKNAQMWNVVEIIFAVRNKIILKVKTERNTVEYRQLDNVPIYPYVQEKAIIVDWKTK